MPSSLEGALDVAALLDRARTMAEGSAFCVPDVENPGLILGAALGEAALAGRDKATFLVSPSLRAFPAWVEQLIAESTGKDDTGILPVADEPAEESAAYGADRFFVYLEMNGDEDTEQQARLADLEAAGHALAPIDAVAAADLMAGGRPGALEAAGLTMTKAAIEVPLLWAMASTAERLAAETTSDLWPRIAALHREDARLDRSSLAVMAAKTRFDSESPQTSDAPAPAMVDRFERSMALDSVRNEYLLHRAIHEWFVTGTVGGDLDALNDKVYTELFATPKSDPWLGLLAADTYAALQDNGVVSFP
ncbi:MAG: hypothetical protein IH804_08290 [Planctomycetes bacterium]|nr:hypothetical protein [Planctomycetota bacterium]